MLTDAHIQEALTLKAEIAQRQARLKELAKVAVNSGIVAEGKQNGRRTLGRGKVTVTLPERVVYDVAALDEAREKMGNEAFFELFTYTYKPRNTKDLNGFLAHSPLAGLIREARTVTPQAPRVSWEEVKPDPVQMKGQEGAV